MRPSRARVCGGAGGAGPRPGGGPAAGHVVRVAALRPPTRQRHRRPGQHELHRNVARRLQGAPPVHLQHCNIYWSGLKPNQLVLTTHLNAWQRAKLINEGVPGLTEVFLEAAELAVLEHYEDVPALQSAGPDLHRKPHKRCHSAVRTAAPWPGCWDACSPPRPAPAGS